MEITKKRAERCTTHYCACDCREYRFQEMERALKVIRTWAGEDQKWPAGMALDPLYVCKLCDEALER